MKIICSGGGTGGHIYPALALMRYIQSQDSTAEFLYIGTEKGLESTIVPNAGFAFRSLEMQGIKRSLSFENIKTLYYFLTSTSHAKKIIKEFQPDVVIGTGGYVSASVLFAAAQLKVPTIIHEQNSVAGLTNKFLARKVKTIATCFEDVAQDFKKNAHKIVLTGNPRGQEVSETSKESATLSQYGLRDDLPIVVIFGGSRGAPAINQAFVDATNYLQQEHYQVVMITGEEHYDKINNMITNKKQQLQQIHVFPYIKDMPRLFVHADLVVCRSGATTLTELTALGIPSILIPSPYVTNNHQQANAESLSRIGAARMILQSDLTGEVLAQTINDLMSNSSLRMEMANQAKQLGVTNASERLWQLIQDVTK